MLDPERPPMTSDQFTEFWCFDLWSGMAMGSAMVPFLPDMSPIITPEEARPQAEKAGQALEKLTHKYKFLDWMRSPYIEESSDFMAIAMFFGVKVRIMATIAQAHRSGGSASPAGEASDLPDGLSDTKQSGATA